MYLGDFFVGDTVYHKFTSRSTGGAPTTLSGSPVVKIYQDNATTTESTAGVTLTVDFDSLTGLNHMTIDTSQDATFYATAHDFMMVITTGTVGGQSVIGEVVGRFSLQNRTALRPTTKGRTLGVAAGGQAGIDWANIGSPTTTVALTGTTVDLVSGAITSIWAKLTSALTTTGSVGKLLVDNIDAAISTRLATSGYTAPDNTTISTINGKLPALVGGRVDVSVGAYQSGQAPLQPTTAGRTLDVASTGEAGLDFDNIKDATGAHTLTNITVPVVTTVASVTALSAGAIQSIWDALTSALTTVGSIGKLLVTNIDAAISSRLATSGYTAPDNSTISTINNKLGTPAGASIAADLAEIEAETDGIAAIPTNPLLTNDSRLNDLDATISSRAPYTVKKNTQLANFEFPMFDALGAPATGLTVTAQRSIDGAAPAACANAVVEVGGGLYKITLAASDLNGTVVGFIFSATGAKTQMVTLVTEA